MEFNNLDCKHIFSINEHRIDTALNFNARIFSGESLQIKANNIFLK
jgi:hypothetical protein